MNIFVMNCWKYCKWFLYEKWILDVYLYSDYVDEQGVVLDVVKLEFQLDWESIGFLTLYFCLLISIVKVVLWTHFRIVDAW
jgi:hypothetical protein